MKKFMVTVNNKYIVAVECTSNGGAEHIVLDNVRNAKSALAFDIEAGETQWEMFQTALKDMEIISIDELKQKDKEVQRQKMLAMNELAEEQLYYENEIKRLEAKLTEAKSNLEARKLNIKEAEREREIKCRFYSQEELAN